MKSAANSILLSILFCLASPAFAGAVPFAKQKPLVSTADEPRSIAFGDIDGDGDDDMVSASVGDLKLAWYPNLGKEKFGVENVIATGLDYTAVAVADIDGDGDPDVVAGTDSDDTLEWHDNTDGLGAFELGSQISTSVPGTTDIAVADLNEDGALDVVVTTTGFDTVQLFLNQGGDGSFPDTDVIFQGTVAFNSIAAGDLDNDGDIDLVAGRNAAGGETTVLFALNPFNGIWSGIDSVTQPTDSVALADINRDGRVDVIAAADAAIYWFPNFQPPPGEAPPLGSGGVYFPVTDFVTAAETVFNSIATADFDRDGDVDVVAGSIDDLYWFDNDDGDFGFQPAITDAVAGAGIVATSDIDGDGDVDVLSAYRDDDRIAVYVNRTIHRSALFPESTLVHDFIDATTVSIGDLDGDGDLDLVSTDADSEELNWYDNDGFGGFPLGDPFSIDIIDGVATTDVADFDRDGNLDVVSGADPEAVMKWHSNLSGNGPDGDDQVTPFFFHNFYSVRAADIDGDGDQDIVAGSQIPSFGVSFSNVTWWENDGSPGEYPDWAGFGIDALGDEVVSVVPTDLDGDGDLDVVAGAVAFPEGVEGLINWYRNDGTSENTHGEALINRPNDDSYIGNVFIGYDAPFGVDGRVTTWRIYDQETPGRLITPLIFQRLSAASCLAAPTTCVYVVKGIGTTRASGGGDSPQAFAFEPIPGSSDQVEADWLFGWKDGTPDAATENPGSIDSDFGVDNEPVTYMEWGLLGSGPAVVQDGFMDNATWDFRTIGGRDYSIQFDTTSTEFVAGGSIAEEFEFIAGVDAADVDGDGDVDVLAAWGDSIAWYEYVEGEGGAGFFWSRNDISDDPGATSIDASDVDGDGDLDVLWTGNDGDFAWFENEDGAGSFGPSQFVDGVDGGSQQLAAADLDRDGDMDLVGAAAFGEGQLAWYENRGGQFRMDSQDLGPQSTFDGELTELLGVTVTMNSRPGDSTSDLTALEIGFAQGESLMNSAEANSVFERILIYRDDGSGRLSEKDIPLLEVDNLVLTGGFQTFLIPDSPNRVVLAPVKFLVVAEIAAGASSSSPIGSFFLIHETASSGAADGKTGGPLDPEPVQDFFTSSVQLEPSYDVDSVADESDVMIGDETCTTASGTCTLRAAIEEASAAPDGALIRVPSNLTNITLTAPISFGTPFGTIKIRGDGPGLTVIDAAGIGPAFIVNFGTAIFEGLTITGGVNPAGPGAVDAFGDVIFENCEIVDSSSFAGAIQVFNNDLTLRSSTISGNTATGVGYGAAVELLYANATIENSTIADNTGSHAIHVHGAQLTLRSSTLSGHNSTSSGAAIYTYFSYSSVIDSSTITDNSHGGVEPFSSQFFMANSIVAGNNGADLIGSDITSNGHNLIGDIGSAAGFVDGVNGDQVGGAGNPVIVPLLSPLADNGGPTLTHALNQGSPALDQGNCPGETADQRGERRPVDLASVADAAGGDGCDVGAYEADAALVTAQLEVPVRWCAVEGAPSVVTPSLVGADSVSDVLRQRLDRVNDEIYMPQAAVRFRSGATNLVEDFPVIPDPVAIGQPGDVFVDPDTANFDEFLQLIASCRVAWEQLDPTVVGVTAVHINRFVDENGMPTELLGLGGRAEFLAGAQQVTGGRLMVVDNFYRLQANPPDLADQLAGHELGHAISLEHGDGEDNDNDGNVDNDDDKAAGKPKFDGPNLMQYRNGTDLSLLQVERARTHAFFTIPDSTLNIAGALAAEAGLDGGFTTILDFGFTTILDFQLEDVQLFGMSEVLDEGFTTILDFSLAEALDEGFTTILDFGFTTILDFGMTIGSTEFGGGGEGTATLVTSTAGVLWPSPIRPGTSYLFYLDVDSSDASGGTPTVHGFPGAGVAVEMGVDVIVRVDLSSSCTSTACTDTETTTVYRWVEDEYVLDPDGALGAPTLKSLTVGLVVDNGGDVVERDDQKIAALIQAPIRSGVLVEAGAQIGTNVAMEILTVVNCASNLPGGESEIPIDCQCTDCNDCPLYEGCTDGGTEPITLDDPAEIVVDCANGDVTFIPPALPTCTVTPSSVNPGGTVTIAATNFPEGELQVFVDDDTVAAGTFTGSIMLPIDPGETAGGLEYTVELAPPTPTGGGEPEGPLAPVAICNVKVNSNSCGDADGDTCDDCSIFPPPGSTADDGDDFDGDGLCDAGDPDDDGDGVADGDDLDPKDPFTCGFSDEDACDDCTSGTFNPADDGTDTDGDGLCDAGDPDDDDDAADDLKDEDDTNADVCSDVDGDTCDDCDSGAFDPSNDGLDDDGDGICAAGDPDDNDPNECGDLDLDTCDDCTFGTFDPTNDGEDFDGDGLCDAGDPDDDGDNVADSQDIDPLNPFACRDTDLDGCDDCLSGIFDPDNDEIDDDEDGFCNSLDNCPVVPNPDQKDFDNDGLGNVCDDCNDHDGDGYAGAEFPTDVCELDNCPGIYNPASDCDDDPGTPDEQCDLDGDGKGDACDPMFMSALDLPIVWPPNHGLRKVKVELQTDLPIDNFLIALTGVTSNEPDDLPGNDDGDTVDDIQGIEFGAPDVEVFLRAERASSGAGRVYTLTYKATYLPTGEVFISSVDAEVPVDVDGLVEPVILTLSGTADGSLVQWTEVANAMHYNVIRGDLAAVGDGDNQIDLGSVVCIESASTDASTSGLEDSEIPDSGQAYFYLVEYNDGWDGGYGTVSAAKPRIPTSDACD